MRESALEAKLNRYAKSVGVKSYKFTGQKGVPDRIYIGPNGVIFVELKIAPNKPTKLQLYHLNQINTVRGETIAYWTDSYEGGVELINKVK